MSLSRQGGLFVVVFLAATAIAGYRGFLAAQPLSDALSAALALALYRTAMASVGRGEQPRDNPHGHGVE